MIVISNTSPIINLAAIGQVDLLKQLYERIFIPEAVLRELLAFDPEQLKAPEMQSLLWMETRSVANRSMAASLLLELDEGVAEAIVLAMEIKADLLLLDERQGRKVASQLGLKFVGLLGVLIEAKHKGFISNVKPILDNLITKAGFWVSNQLYIRVLREAKE